MTNAYLQDPCLYKDMIYFICDDDIWSVSTNGGTATRVTSSKGRIKKPIISPNGQYIAYLGNDDAFWDAYIMERSGGPSKRLTYSNGLIKICRWKNNHTLILSTSQFAINQCFFEIFEFNIEDFTTKKVPVGTAHNYLETQDIRLLGRNNGDPARWKRYKGGTAGTLWVDEEKNGHFKKILKNISHNIFNPTCIHKRIYFISDHEGIANIYSCTYKGHGLKRHTHQKDFYVRNFSYHSGNLIYQCGAELFLLNLDGHDHRNEKKINISVPSHFLQAEPRYCNPINFIQDLAVTDRGDEITVLTRGQLFTMAPWKGGTRQLGKDHHRYKLPSYLHSEGVDKSIISVEMSPEQEETLVHFNMNNNGEKIFEEMDWGKIQEISSHPQKPLVAIATNRNQLWLLDIKRKKAELIEKSHIHYFSDLNWSPNNDILAYAAPYDKKRKGIKLFDLKKKKSSFLIEPILNDFSPIWDKDGNYLYFIGHREFHPVYNETHFDLGFPFASRIYAVGLNKNMPSPLDLYLEYETEEEDDGEKDQREKQKNEKKKKEVEIHWQDIEQRIYALPVSMGGHQKIFHASDKILFTKGQIQGLDPQISSSDGNGETSLYSYCLKEKKQDEWEKDIAYISTSHNKKYALIELEEDIRLISTESKPSDDSEYNKKDGWIDLSRVRLLIHPKEEWSQMYQEAWILQREHFWTPDMSKVNWEDIYIQYLSLLEKCHTRSEFSDLMWEMQGELGTGHCYEMYGDYHRKGNFNPNGHLGAELQFNSSDRSYTIKNIFRGASWISSENSPLLKGETALREGDKIIRLDGREFHCHTSIDEMLEGRANKNIQIDVLKNGKNKEESLHVKTLSSHQHLLYRQWVEKNRKYVHEKSKGKIGYVHIPDMAVKGYSEFYTNFLRECGYEGLIVDIRFNGGGHISQHILKILAQKVLGHDLTRWLGVESYPNYAVNGPIVAITNEHAGSDGDIFSHAFKLMKIGKLIGKRTWGGVIGISPRFTLNDGTVTTQPEYSHWFKDVGFAVENYGTNPDIEVEILPSDYKNGKDPQLDRAIQEALKEDKERPVIRPSLKSRPNLKRPKLPAI